MHKDTLEWTLIDIAVPTAQNTLTTEDKQVERYQELTLKFKRIHRAQKVEAIPIVIGELGTVSKYAKVWYGKLTWPKFFGSAQMSAILGTAHILQRVLCL